MPLHTVALQRPITSYAKVESVIGNVIRNRRFQLRRIKANHRHYVDIGAGRTIHDGFIHVDYLWHSGIELCWDIRNGLPFGDASLAGIYSQHMFEHFSLPAVREILRDCRRMLAPGGTIRIVVPDAELYLTTYQAQINGNLDQQFPYEDADAFDGIRSPLLSVNRIFYCDRDSPYGHRTMYDYRLLSELLRAAGFAAMAKCAFGAGRDPKLLVDAPERKVESLYVEASVA